MVDIDAVICLYVQRDARGEKVVYYIRVARCGNRELFQYPCRHLTETARRNFIPGPLGSWASRARGWNGATRRYERWIRGPSGGDVNRYKSVTLRVDQAAEIT